MTDHSVPPAGPPTDLGWMLSCSGVHPEAVRIVEAYQAENERLRGALMDVALTPDSGDGQRLAKAERYLASDDSQGTR